MTRKSGFIFCLCALCFVGISSSFVIKLKSASSSNHLVELYLEAVDGTASASYAVFNFGPASARDTVLFTAERPGNPRGKTDIANEQQVQDWLAFMKEQRISHVIALLDENEFANYAAPGLLKRYENAGLTCLVQPMRDRNAKTNIFRFVRQVEAVDGRVVAHCTGGIGRAGRVAAGWLVER